MPAIFFPEILNNLSNSRFILISSILMSRFGRPITILFFLFIDFAEQILFNITFHNFGGCQKRLVKLGWESSTVLVRDPFNVWVVQFLAHLPLTSVVVMVLNDPAIPVRLTFVEWTLVNLTRNHAVPSDAMILIIFVDLPKILVKAIFISKLHHSKTVVNLDFPSVDPSLKRNFLQSVPFVSTCLVAWLVLPR